jgi:hypothetical protein
LLVVVAVKTVTVLAMAVALRAAFDQPLHQLVVVARLKLRSVWH